MSILEQAGRVGRRSSAVAILGALAVWSCSDQMITEPASVSSEQGETQIHTEASERGGPGFFPLTSNNCFYYSGQTSVYVSGDSFVQVAPYIECRALIGSEELFGRDYTVEVRERVSFWPPPNGPGELSWIRYRQDKAGLYEADVDISQPPALTSAAQRASVARSAWSAFGKRTDEFLASARKGDPEAYRRAVTRLERKIALVYAAVGSAPGRSPHRIGPPGGVLADELTRLKYPLHPGQSWTIRGEPALFTSTVEAFEVVDLPAGRFAGWRIRTDIELLGPSDTVLTWYGRDGFLRLRVHLETEETDYEHPYGTGRTLIFEERMVLEGFELAK